VIARVLAVIALAVMVLTADTRVRITSAAGNLVMPGPAIAALAAVLMLAVLAVLAVRITRTFPCLIIWSSA